MKKYKDCKRKAVGQAEIEVTGAEHLFKAIKMEIEDTKVKGQMELTFLRFPHIGEQILEKLDDQSLFKCQNVSKPWQNFITEKKILPIALLQKHTLIPKAKLKKSLLKHDVKVVQELANCAIKFMA